MKMQRSHCENENVQFVQELAEVDGPFESPININFRDLTKLELPPLAWNRAEVSPKKMKITNTGHTVIISGKWKCERPYLTGGPLSGKYVFSQIHFHWGQDDCRGSEHQICGESFPLEMHVAHFKTEYLTQECALREKDGMVVVVYLFKLQDEPNASLKKILNLLPNVKQASTSHAVDPKPILTLCNPFTEDYFMYWGSVVTSTCAHILLWIISREPFGISREQVNEFRKILDTSHQPICRNSRETQPLHRRNVFHVNASKHLDEALLPVRKVLGCYCKGSEDNIPSAMSASNDCSCQAYLQNQEDVEGNTVVEHAKRHYCSDAGGKHAVCWKASLTSNCFANQSVFVHTATIHSIPMLVKRFDSEPVRNHCCLDYLKQTKSEGDTQLNPVTNSCCFLMTKEFGKIKSRAEKRKVREKKKPFKSVRAFSHLMDSLEAIKNQTFKKLKEIESINQEIKGMKPFCQDSEDKRWLRRIEKIISRQKRFTIKSSQGCFSELKKLARECNFDKFFEGKALQVGDNNQKMMWLNDNEMGTGVLPYTYNYTKGEEIPQMEMTSSKNFNFTKAVKFSTKAQKLIQSFFEDIKESDDLQETVKKDLSIRKIESFCRKQAGDANSVSTVNKGYITQRMFTLGNLGDRFFTAVSTDDFEIDENNWPDKEQAEDIIVAKQGSPAGKTIGDNETKKPFNDNEVAFSETTTLTPTAITKKEISPQSGNVAIEIVKSSQAAEAVECAKRELSVDYEAKVSLKDPCDSETQSSDDNPHKPYSSRETKKKSLRSIKKELSCLTNDKLLRELHARMEMPEVNRSSSNLSMESTERQQTIIAKIRKRQSRKDVWEQKSSMLFIKMSSSKGFSEKTYKKPKLRNPNFGGYLHKKNLTKRKCQRIDSKADNTSWDLSSTSREERKVLVSKSKWKQPTKDKFKLEAEKYSESTLDSAIESSLISPERKKLKLESKKAKERGENKFQTESEDARLKKTESRDDARGANESMSTNTENPVQMQTKFMESKSAESQQRRALSRFLSKTSANESCATSRASSNKTFRASSVDSRTSYVEKEDSKILEKSELSSQIKIETLKKEVQAVAGLKTAIKNRSLNNISTTAKIHSAEINQRIFVETIDDRRQSSREVSELRRRIETPRKTEETLKVITTKDFNSDTSNELNKKFDEDWEQKNLNRSCENLEKPDAGIVGKVEYNVRFLRPPLNQAGEEIMSESQEGKGKAAAVKRCDADKYQFLEAGPQESTENYLELPRRSDSNKSFTQDSSKGDANQLFLPSEDPLSVDNTERQASISYSILQKTSKNKHHSAENLISLTKIPKQKSKKRPHCCKRSSKHYIRKNSTMLKKPNKVESKQLHLLNLTDEEQLKIISANVAKYLKQKLVDQNTESNTEKKCSFKDIQEVVYNNLLASHEKAKETPQDESHTAKECETKAKETPDGNVKEKAKKAEKKQVNTEKTLVIKSENETKKEKSAIPPSKPVHNFIKRNKQMAGKYKRTPPLVEKNAEAKKREEEKPKPENLKFKLRTQNKRKEKGSPQKQESHAKCTSESTSLQENQKQRENLKKGSRFKSPKSPKKPDSKSQSNRQKSKSPDSKPEPEPDPRPEPTNETLVTESEQSNQLVKCRDSSMDSFSSPIVLRKIPQPKKRLVPAYMVTSYLPAPIEIVEGQKRKMNKYLLSMNNAQLENYLPEVLHEGKNKKRDRGVSDSVFEKELEYLIKLQMCLNEEITTNIENSMNYVKTLLSPDYSLPHFDSGANKGVVLVEMKDMDWSSSGSDITEDISRYYLMKETQENKSESNPKDKHLPCIKMPQESGDSGVISPIWFPDGQEDFNSDSSYDCKISITLNPNTKEGEGEMQSYDTFNYLGENSNSQTTIYLEGSSSQSTVAKPHRKKRKENEISMEMKQKLLEILEGEIKREIGIAGGVSSEISSDGLTIKWEDSDGNNRSQSTESSCDNIEMLTQISETMKQYLSDFKERRLGEIITESSDKESKDDE